MGGGAGGLGRGAGLRGALAPDRAEAGGAPSRRARLAVAGGFGLLVFAALAWLARAQGITWDEARDYLLWVRRFDAWVDAVLAEGAAAWTRERIDAGVASDDRHPHLFKLMGWLSASLLPDALPFPLRARLGPAAFVAATLAFALHHLLGRYGWLPAAAALLAVVGQPRFLGHGSFLATDAPLACFVLLGVLACADAERSPRARALLYVAVAGAIWTKFTGVGLPVVLGLGCLLRGRPRLLVHLALASALGLGLLALTFPPWRLAAFFGQAVEHGYSRPFSVYFLGEWYAGRPPWTWLPVMLAVVPPVGVALTMGGGTLALALRTVRARDPLAIQLLVACAAFGALFLLPFVPRHDGIRQALYLFVLLGVAGGLGLGLAAQSWLARTEATLPRVLLVAAALLLPASGLVVAWRERPLLLSTFSEAVGGLHGAYYRLRLEPTYWADAVTPAVLAELNALLPPGATLAMPFPGEYPFRLRRLGLLRSDVVPSLDGEYLLLLNRTSLIPVARRRIEHAQELQRWERHGVPLLILYRVGKPREPGR